MDVVAAARALNQKAARQNWYHFCDPTLAFSDSSYEQLLDLWRTKAGGRPMPSRSDMTPRDIKNILRDILVFERMTQNPSSYRFRLIGTGLTWMAGDNTGKMLEEAIPAEHIPRWVECGDLILDGGQPLRFLGRVHLHGREYLDAENLFVPLANDDDVPTFVMGLCRYTPRRSDSEDQWENQLASLPGGLL
ncbi:MAG TPA: PAS domain-containing protein [Rhizomicrobium sp.]|jgi:hypothetical protein